MTDGVWQHALRRYMVASLLGHAIWEVAQLPLYTLWHEATARQVAVATLHCLGGDLAIASTVLVAALVLAGHQNWPGRYAGRVAALVLLLGIAYTGWSEYSNAIVKRTWSYTPAMPLVPWLGIGITPLLQWLIVPSFALLVASRTTSRVTASAR